MALLFLPIPTAGLFFWVIVSVFGEFFLDVAVAWTLGIGGAYLSMILFAILSRLGEGE